ncbi:MAG: DUF192 domain-containing protein [Myxococcota bacterium]
MRIALLIALGLSACSSSAPSDPAKPAEAPEQPEATPTPSEAAPDQAEATPTDENAVDEPSADTTPTVTFHTDGGDVVVAVEIVADPLSRQRGMMYRESLEDDRGMVFVFPSEGQHPFWMKNTYIALDMIHLDSAFNVVGVVENAEPLTLTQRKVDAASKYVVEVVGGFAARVGVKTGTRSTLANVPSEAR